MDGADASDDLFTNSRGNTAILWPVVTPEQAGRSRMKLRG